MAKDTTFSITDVRGGLNDSDSPTLLPANQVVAARNVDFREGALGSKRRGTEGIDLTGAAFDSPVVAIFSHTPSNSVGDDELWGIDENGNMDRRVGGSWQGSIAAVNDSVTVRARNFDANAVSLHGKLFIAAQGDEDRLLVWDGTTLRWAGIQQPPVPTVADTGSGSYSGTRYFRIRFVEKNSDATVTLRRSEPTDTVSLEPSGSGSGALITKPSGTELTSSVYCEGQTHWEVEASVDNILFYRIATVAIATSTYTDSTSFSTGYASNTLSENVGEYIPPVAPRHLAVDEDRLVLAGSYFTEGYDSTVWWTPVGGDDGVGNDERVPITTNNFITFDGLDGGRINALVAGVSGNVYVLKTSRIHKMVRTGVVSSAYSPVTESFSRGAVLRGATAGVDQQGVPCVYFLDSSVGLCRLGQRGVEDLAKDIRADWRRRNLNPLIGPRILYYPELDQVWYTNPTGSGDAIQTVDGETLADADAVEIHSGQTAPTILYEYEIRYGANMPHDGLLGNAYALALANYGGERGLAPVIGTQEVSIEGGGTSTLHFADTGTTDSGTEFQAYVRTKPYSLGDLWTKFGLMAGVLLAKASEATTLTITMIRNFGVEEREVSVDLTPEGAEEHVIRPIDNATMSELNTIQIEYGDAEASAQTWSADQFVFRIRPEEGSAG